MKQVLITTQQRQVWVLEAESTWKPIIDNHVLFFVADQVEGVDQIKDQLAIADPFWTHHYYGLLEYANMNQRLEVTNVFVIPSERLAFSLFVDESVLQTYAKKKVAFRLESNGIVHEFALNTQPIDRKVEEAEAVIMAYERGISEAEVDAFYQ